MRRAEPWQKAEIPGPEKALVITRPEVVTAMIKRAKRPLLILGYESAKLDLGEEKLIDYAIKLAESVNIPMVATGHTVSELTKRGFQHAAFMPAVDIANRLRDPDWKGLDGLGQYDLVLVTGLRYYLAWVMLSGLKHFAYKVKTISLDRFYQPHASWSFPNLPVDEWHSYLIDILKSLGG